MRPEDRRAAGSAIPARGQVADGQKEWQVVGGKKKTGGRKEPGERREEQERK